MKSRFKGNMLLLLTSLIWGNAFVAQRTGMNFVGPFTYNAIRNFLGSLVLLPVIIFIALSKKDKGTDFFSRIAPDKTTLIGGIICGVALTVGSAFQQMGITMTSAGKTGFITALYIIIVPILSSFLGKKFPKAIWICVLLAITGFYLLCVDDGFYISTGDILILCCAFAFSFQIMAIDHFASLNTDCIKMSCIEFFTAGILSLLPMVMSETPTADALWSARYPILYAGILSSGVAYTLQIIGQKYTDPTSATLIMSLEAVFAVLAGWIILKEMMSLKELAGCFVVFIAVILAQIPPKKLQPIKPGIKSSGFNC